MSQNNKSKNFEQSNKANNKQSIVLDGVEYDPFSLLKIVSHTKKDPFKDLENPELLDKYYKEKCAWIINTGLSLFPDSILAANEMNRSSHLDGRLQFTYLLNTLRPRNRYEKWLKNRVSQEVKDVSEYYGYNITKAKEALKILSDEDLKIIHTKLEKGG